MDRTEFLKQLMEIPTRDGETGGAAAPSKVSSTLPSSRRLDVMFEVVHPESPMSGSFKLMIQDTEQLQNLRQTIIDIGIGTSFVFRYNGAIISSTKSLRDISYDPSKKIYLGAGVEPVVAPAPTPALTPTPEPEEKSKKTNEDYLVETARFLKALVALAKTGEKKDTTTAIALMEKNKKIQREHLPTELLNTPQIWNALLSGMGMTALVRNLGKLSQVGVASTRSQDIIKMLTDPKSVKDSKIHPLQVLVGMKTYSQGKGDLGSMTWTPNSYITTALSTTFRQSFGNITSTGKRYMIGLDVSGSMTTFMCAGAKNITPREGSIAMAMMTLYAEGAENVHIYGFSNTFYNFNGKVRPDMTVQDAIKATDVPFGATNCALPMTEALKMYRESGIVFDVFCVYTDSETYAPTVHPQVALEVYRKETRVDAKLIVVGMTSNCLTIADPKDKNTLNLAGFDTSTPELISMFVRGEI